MTKDSKFTKNQKVWMKATVCNNRLDEDGEIKVRICDGSIAYANPSEIHTTHEIWIEHVKWFR